MDINEIIDLANSLRQERLFITTEQQTLQSLNEQVVQNSLEVYQAAWISAQQRVNLNRLTVARPNSTPALCCQRASLLETITFVDAFKVLKYQDVLSYGAFLQCLRRAPQLVASCLVLGDRLVSDSMPHIALSLAAGLYGTCLAPEDTNLMLQLLNYLMEMQIVRSETPQRMLRQGSCAFSSLYSVFHEGLFSAKLFLSAALKGPVMQLLMEEEMFLDIDPDKTVIRYPPEERVKKFGKEGTAEFQTKTQQHRKWTVNSLVTITNRFIVSLRDHWLLFPNSVAWLVRQMAALMVKENFQEKELNAMCTDLIFTHFICPAIVNPEPYGVTDAPISHIARFNLMQVAQILQMLALIQYQDVEIKLKDLYSKFDKDSVSTLLDSLLVASESDDIMAISNTRTPTFIRTATFFTLAELQGFVSFFRLIADDPNPIKSNDVASNCIEQGFKSQLAGLLGPLPSPTDGVRGLLRGQGDSNSSSEALSSSPDIPKRGLLGKVSKPRISRISSGSLDNPTEDTTTPATVGTNGNNNLLCSPEAEKFTHNVLIIPFPDVQSELIGLLPEHEVLSHDLPAMPAQSNMTAPILTNTILPEVDISRPVPPDQMTEVSSVLTGSTGIEKRTRFSLSHDEGSIGNTSDNLEAVSEAASNHSVASSLELENEDQNDNLSDMVSANVSGRGTPNISGRDTPSSQVTEGGASEPRPPLATPTSKSLKQTRSDIQDKFCKFEIKKLLEGDETISIISDTWSTDVLASDSEIIEAYERSFGMGGHLTSRPPVFAPSQVLTEENNRIMIGPQIPDRVLDVSETQSESAWSTDVLASDSERMTEVDTDDCQSVARSDTDTARSEVDVEARVEPPLPDLPPLGPLQRFPSPISPLPNLSPLFLPQPLSRMERTASTLAKSSRDVPRPDDHGEVRNFEMFHGNFLQNGSLNSPTLVSARNNNPLQRESINEGRFTGRSLSLFEPNTCRLNLLDGSTNRLGSFFNQPRCEVPNPDSLINNSVFHSTSSPFVSSLVNGPFRLFGTQTQNHFDNVTSTEPLCSPRSLSESVQNAHAHVCLNNPSSDVSDSSVAANKINSGVAFRPIHDEKSMFNVTGKGGRLSDYRRRTLEYVNSNSNINLPHSPGSNGDVLENPLEEYNEMVHIESDIPIKEFTNGDNICNGISDLVSQMRSASISDISAHSSTNSTTIQRQSISLSILDDKIIQNKEITINNLILPVVNHIVGADARLPTVDLSVPVEHNNLTAKPSSSTGAIPKSISFDSTAEKAHRDYDDSKMKRGTGNFFNKLKLGFKNRRGKGRGNGDDVRFEDSPIHNIESIKNKRHGYDERVALQSHETTEDILAKYRRKVSISSDVATSGGSDSTASQSSSIKSKSIQSDEQNDSRLKIDRTNRESGYTYEDAKRKLRLVLSTADLQCTDFKHSNATLETPLVSFLRIQLSEAIALQDGALIAQLHEALRSVRAIGAPGSRNLCRELLLEFKGRGQYILYLVQARQALLRTLSYLDRLLTRILCDRSVCNSHLIWECVRLFLERRECQLNSFCDEFRALSVADEKTYLLHTFVNEILREINRDQNWQAASDHQLLTASLAVERVVMGRVYLQALYPNGDGDISRDQVLYEHIRKLSRIVTVTHKDLRIPLRYHQESPWPYAQSAIQSMAAYRAPRDKVQCVVRCVTTIMHLLSMSGRDGRTVPAADDLIPVLVYVLIKANPPSLLSTIQYVDSFYGNCLTGEAQYWWIQFCSAVEFIKTMDYRD